MRASLAFLAMGIVGVAGVSAPGNGIAASESVTLTASETQGAARHVSGNTDTKHVGVEVSLDDGEEGGDENFLYLKGDFESRASVPFVDITKGSAEGLGLADDIGALGTFTPRYGAVRFGFAQGNGLGASGSGLDVALTSQFVIGGRPAFDPLSVGLSPLDPEDRAVNLGFSLGYAGFNIGARYLYGDDALNYGYRGYDIGLGYVAGQWGTRLGFTGVTPSASGVGMNLLETESQYTVRLGAFYRIFPGLTLGGRFQYHDYRLFDSLDSRNRGEFFLNTNVNF